jgi:hypothetical protein
MHGGSERHLLALVTPLMVVQAEQFITTAHRSICRAERISRRALRVRERTIQNLHTRFAQGMSPSNTEASAFLHAPNLQDYGYPSTPLSSAVSSVYSFAQPSSASLGSTITDTDDEDTKALRGLLLRKIGTRLDGSFEETDKVTTWLRIVRETVCSVKYRAGL